MYTPFVPLPAITLAGLMSPTSELPMY